MEENLTGGRGEVSCSGKMNGESEGGFDGETRKSEWGVDR